MTLVPLVAAALLWFLLSRTGGAKRLLRIAAPGLPAKAMAILLVVLAMLVAARGDVWAALCLFGASLWSLGRTAGAAHTPRPPPIVEGRGSTIRIVGGRLRGSRLEALDLAACLLVREDCAADPPGRLLLETYLDRRFPGWRPAAHGDADARRRPAHSATEMSEEQAYHVLGLGRGATRAEIVRSHRETMKRWHPDQGGTTDAAALANEAKEVLLRRHV